MDPGLLMRSIGKGMRPTRLNADGIRASILTTEKV
jgi:hypothetical protein